MRVGIYGPYFRIMGGGELYLGAIAEVLSSEYQVDLISESEISLSGFQRFFGLDLSKVQVRIIPQIPFIESLNPFLRKRTAEYLHKTLFTQDYDLFILMPRNFRIPFRTLSKRSILHLQVPDRPWNFGKYCQRIALAKFSEIRNEIAKSLLYPRRYAQFDAVLINSEFHKNIISGRLKNDRAIVLPPPVNLRQPKEWSQKEKLILGVGRFFRGLHSKRQDVLIDTFRSFSNQVSGWRMILAGGLADDPSSQEYFEELRQASKDLEIELLPNISVSELNELFSQARFFWHAAGYGVKSTEPEKMEHFGISTVEAMSAGCLPLVYRAGGQEEIIQEGINGFFWNSKDELVQRTFNLANSNVETLSASAVQRSSEFGKEKFVERLTSLIEIIFTAKPQRSN